MSYFHETLFILRQKQIPVDFITAFNKVLLALDLSMELGENAFIVFNDSVSGEEKDALFLTEEQDAADVVDIVCAWPGLGLIDYRHPDFSFPVSVNYRSWDDSSLQGLVISFQGKDVVPPIQSEKHRQLIEKISQRLDYLYMFDDMGHAGDFYIDTHQNLETIIQCLKHLDKGH